MEHRDLVQSRVSEVEDEQVSASVSQKKLDKSLEVLHAKAEDFEAQSRCYNILIVGLAESTNTGKMEKFVEQLLESMGRETFSDRFVMECAHRSFVSRPIPGSPGISVITGVLNYRDRDAVIQEHVNCQGQEAVEVLHGLQLQRIGDSFENSWEQVKVLDGSYTVMDMFQYFRGRHTMQELLSEELREPRELPALTFLL
ncbi:hypothetical protein NDU88_001945 [Pleurodeles waltl]|uniref:AIG1-type G domain-containing protein n=1 Tax=Pleurodeles waltl TaxID=8319 RepID=A0AAV7U8E8_PLEWA|nr:hypothetical protein NDU88_001945 [Pleurodeles waltl]